MKNLSYQNGDIIPIVGLGTWRAERNEMEATITEALRLGYKHIDCAYLYGNEAEIGETMHRIFQQGKIKREEIHITSKLWNSSHAPEQVEIAARKSLKDLQLDYLDLYLMHWPIAFRTGQDQPRDISDLIPLPELPLSATWKAIAELKQKGITKHIGVSNFNIPKLKRLIAETGIVPEVNQIELHPYLQQDELVKFCQDNNIIVTAYSPLGSRHLVETGEGIDKQQIVLEIAKKHNCSAAQVLLAWNIHRSVIVIPKSTNPVRLKDNLDSIHIKLDENDMKQIAKLDRNHRTAPGTFAILPNGAYTLESIWNE